MPLLGGGEHLNNKQASTSYLCLGTARKPATFVIVITGMSKVIAIPTRPFYHFTTWNKFSRLNTGDLQNLYNKECSNVFGIALVKDVFL